MSDPIILSNTCIGRDVWVSKFNKEYNNPFIATLIPNDIDFIRLCNNILYYINCTPILSPPRDNTSFAIQNSGKWYKHSAIPVPYPVIFLDDIEIHCIHEKDNNTCIDKFTRRLERMRTHISNNNCKILGILSYSEFINNHIDIQKLIDTYLSNPNNIFIGPTKYKNIPNNNYIILPEFDNIKLIRNSSHIYVFNNQNKLRDIFINHITNYYT